MYFVLQCLPTTTNGSFSLFPPCPNGRLSFPISSSAFFLLRPFPAISFPSFFFFAGAILRRCGTFDSLEADFFRGYDENLFRLCFLILLSHPFIPLSRQVPVVRNRLPGLPVHRQPGRTHRSSCQFGFATSRCQGRSRHQRDRKSVV